MQHYLSPQYFRRLNMLPLCQTCMAMTLQKLSSESGFPHRYADYFLDDAARRVYRQARENPLDQPPVPAPLSEAGSQVNGKVDNRVRRAATAPAALAEDGDVADPRACRVCDTVRRSLPHRTASWWREPSCFWRRVVIRAVPPPEQDGHAAPKTELGGEAKLRAELRCHHEAHQTTTVMCGVSIRDLKLEEAEGGTGEPGDVGESP